MILWLLTSRTSLNLAATRRRPLANSKGAKLVCSPIGFKALNVKTEASINQTLRGAIARAATGAQVLQANTLQDGDLTSANAVGGSGTISGAGVVVAGNFVDLIVAEWASTLLTTTRPTLRESGIIRCISNSYVDADVVRDSLRVMAVSSSDITVT